MSVKSLLDPATSLILEEAILQEIKASLSYRQIANLCKRIGLFGAEKYFLKESGEELNHYQKIADYVNDRGDVAFIPDVPSPQVQVQSLRDALTVAYQMETALGALYEKWYLSVSGYDVTTAQFLLQFLEIQRTSIGEIADLIARLDQAQDDPAAIIVIDAELGD